MIDISNNQVYNFGGTESPLVSDDCDYHQLAAIKPNHKFSFNNDASAVLTQSDDD
jgi:hypothetical protein